MKSFSQMIWEHLNSVWPNVMPIHPIDISLKNKNITKELLEYTACNQFRVLFNFESNITRSVPLISYIAALPTEKSNSIEYFCVTKTENFFAIPHVSAYIVGGTHIFAWTVLTLTE